MDRNHDKSKHVCGGAGKSRKRSANVGVGTDSREGKELAEKLPKWHSHVTSQLFLTPEQKASQKNPDGTYKKGRWIPKIDDVFVHLEWEDTKFEKK